MMYILDRRSSNLGRAFGAAATDQFADQIRSDALIFVGSGTQLLLHIDDLLFHITNLVDRQKRHEWHLVRRRDSCS